MWPRLIWNEAVGSSVPLSRVTHTAATLIAFCGWLSSQAISLGLSDFYFILLYFHVCGHFACMDVCEPSVFLVSVEARRGHWISFSWSY